MKIAQRVQEAETTLSDEHIPGTNKVRPYIKVLDLKDPVDIVWTVATLLRALDVPNAVVRQYVLEALSGGYTKAIVTTARYVKVL